MKDLEIPFLAFQHRNSSVEQISFNLDALNNEIIGAVSWPAYNYKPGVCFSIAHANEFILLKYRVREQQLKAAYRKTNDPVYKDSCVEFFIAFGNDKAYYNLEFNCIGTCLAGFGESRIDRKVIPSAVIELIQHHSVIKSVNIANSQIDWELTLAIPVKVFYFHQLKSLGGLTARVNFYKCGDELIEPHYLSWNKIESEEVSFHLPEFFGKAHFAEEIE
ncbi:carbohydrate-binding family 9-like protein [Rubrolithibacter danxiaensis]|uniref:carbohydrate-binding family 9-like protein n=1 Tax=Rubrolithibacter danxiaensis TaxID=3390805 RepID=UPI003BF81137